MRKFTLGTTLAAIVAGTIAVCSHMMPPFIGLIFAPIPLSPLFLTLLLSALFASTGAQTVLLTSTVLFAAYFTRWFYFALRPDGTLDLPAMFYPLPFMLIFWVVAGVLHLRRRHA